MIWNTLNYTVLTSTTTSVPMHDVAWDPSTVNEFVSVGTAGIILNFSRDFFGRISYVRVCFYLLIFGCVLGTVMFWLLDETNQSVSLNVHEADVPEDLIHSHNSVSHKMSCSDCQKYFSVLLKKLWVI